MTGATGFLGSHLLRALVARGRRVVCLRRESSSLARVADVADRAEWVFLEGADLGALLVGAEVECVLHCATDYGRKRVDPLRTIEANLILPLKLLHAAAAGGVGCFVSTDTILDKGIDNYTLSKGQFGEWLARYSNRLTAVNVALEHFYGPGDDPSKFVTYVLRELLGGSERIALTRGEQRRDFIYIDDVVAAFLAILDALPGLDRGLHRYEVGAGATVSIRAFVELARDLAGAHKTFLDFGALPYRPHEVMESHVALAALEALGWRAQVPLEEGLRRTIAAERRL